MGSFRRQLACVAALAATHAFMAPATRDAAPPRRAERTVVRGIPKMFRWLTDQYPSIMERISDGLPAQGERGAVVDNLYLDMNGIIHMCTHSNDAELVVMSEREQFVRIFTFTDKICNVKSVGADVWFCLETGSYTCVVTPSVVFPNTAEAVRKNKVPSGEMLGSSAKKEAS